MFSLRANVASVKLAQTLIIQVFLQASIDNDFQLSGRFHYRWNSALVTKNGVQLAPGPGAMFSLEMTTTAQIYCKFEGDQSINIRRRVDWCDHGSYLQSVTPQLALGLEAVWNRAAVTTARRWLSHMLLDIRNRLDRER